MKRLNWERSKHNVECFGACRSFFACGHNCQGSFRTETQGKHARASQQNILRWIMKEVYLKARGFIYRNARPLDLARFRFHFEAGKKEDVLSVLSYYQNADGGFGHALEPDAWNPASSPIQTWAATEILREIEFFDGGCSLIKGILDYLENTPYFDGHFWANIIPSNNLHPHAPCGGKARTPRMTITTRRRPLPASS